METRRGLLQAQGFGGAPGPGRPNPAQSDAVRVFVAQMIPLFEAINDAVAEQIPKLTG
jgi:hypothetical protein